MTHIRAAGNIGIGWAGRTSLLWKVGPPGLVSKKDQEKNSSHGQLVHGRRLLPAAFPPPSSRKMSYAIVANAVYVGNIVYSCVSVSIANRAPTSRE